MQSNSTNLLVKVGIPFVLNVICFVLALNAGMKIWHDISPKVQAAQQERIEAMEQLEQF